MSETTLLKALFRRRVPQILGLYLGAAWIAIEFSDLIVDRYALSQTLVDFLLVLLASFVPTVSMLAWFHGAPGPDEWTRVEKIGIPLNFVLSIVLLALLFQGEELGATTTAVTVTDEDGQQVERVLAKPELRKRIAVFFLDNQSDDPELDWLQYGLTVALATDLGQSMFLNVWTPYREFESRGFTEFRKAGFADGLDVPMALMQSIAQEKRRDFFITGAFDKAGDQYTLQLDAYRTAGSGFVFSKRVSGPNIVLLADDLNRQLKEAIGLPEHDTRDKLGITGRAAESHAALRLAVLGMNAEHLDNDLEKAVEYWRQAVEIDPGFAMVHMKMAYAIFQLGDMEGASRAIRQALQHDYKLTDDSRFIAKALNYALRNELQKTLKVYEMWVELYPENTLARKYLAVGYTHYASRPRDALAQFELAYELDPGDDFLLLEMARLHELLGELDQAAARYELYAKENPEDPAAPLEMAAMLLNAGHLQSARENYERAELLAPERAAPLVGLADVAIREGRYEVAGEHLASAESVVRIPQQEARVIRGWIDYHQTRGQIGTMLDLVDRLYEVEKTYLQPINLMMMTHVQYASSYALAGEAERGSNVLARLQAGFEPPLDGLADVGFMQLWLAAGDADKGRDYVEKVDAFLQLMQQERYYYVIDMARGRLAELDGDIDKAVEFERQALDRFSQSLSSTEDENDRMRINLSLAQYLISADRLDEAQLVLDDYLHSHPAHPIANLQLARLERARGNDEKAQEALKIALDAYVDADDAYPPAVEATRLAAALGQSG